MKSMIKLSYTLALYTVIACVALAFVYNITEPLIAASLRAEVNNALAEIYPEAVSFDDVSAELSSGDDKISFDSVYVAQGANGPLGIVVKTTGPTYGTATLMVGINPDKTIKIIKILSIDDTPGLGSKAKDEPFKSQFTARAIKDSYAVGKAGSGSDIVAISGATITSKAVSRMVSLAGTKGSAYLDQNFGSAQ